MFESKTLRATLAGTTALIGVAFPTLSKQIMAATITTAQTTTFQMQTGDFLTVSNTGSISASPDVEVHAAANRIDNSGLLLAPSQAIFVGLGGSLSGGVGNQGEINGGYAGLFLGLGGSISGGVGNQNEINGGFAGVFLGSNSTISGVINNSGLLHGGTDGISVTSGSHIDVVDNAPGGTISGGNTGIDVINGSTVSGNITNESGSTILGIASDGVSVDNGSDIVGGVINDAVIHGGHAGISVQSNSDIVAGISNQGTISGGVSGIYVGSHSAIDQVITNGTAGGGGFIEGSEGIIVTGDSQINEIDNVAGSISGSNTGIVVTSHSSISGVIANEASAMIQGTAGDGISVDNNSTLSGGVVNHGQIQGGPPGSSVGGNDGISVQKSSDISGAVNNFSEASIHGNVAGIFVGSESDISGGINNAGGSISGHSYGINIVSAQISGGIANSGTIIGMKDGIRVDHGDIAPGILNQAGGIIEGESTGVALINGQMSAGIDNTGTIQGLNRGVSLASGSDLTIGIINRAGGIISGGVTGIAVQSSDISGSIDNSGSIRGNTAAIAVRLNADIAGGINNRASGIVSGSHAGILVTGVSSDISGGVDNSGEISAGNGIEVASHGDITGGIKNEVGGSIAGGLLGGIVVIGGGDISSLIENSGTISGRNAGILATGAGSDISGGVDNFGTISGGSPGIDVFSYAIGVVGGGKITDGFTNEATGIIKDTAGAGVFVTGPGSDIPGGMDNLGTITARYGIEVSSAGKISGEVNNHGTIAGTHTGIFVTGAGSDLSGLISNSGTISGGNGIEVAAHGGMSGGITNEVGGSIQGGAPGAGILVIGGSDISGPIDNAGSIVGGAGIKVASNSNISGGVTNEAGGSISGNHTAGIVVIGGNVGGISNAGTISGGIGASAGVSVGAGARITGGIANSGQIQGLIGINNAGTISGGITDSNIVSSINNPGTIYGVTAIKVSGAAIAGGITDTGTIKGTGGTAISLVGLTGATPININGGHIIGDVIDDAPGNGHSVVTVGGDFTTEGDFNVSDMSVTAGHTLTISADNTLTLHSMTASAGTLNFGVNSKTSFGSIVVAGAPDLTNTPITVQVGGGSALAPGANFLATGDEMKIIDGSAAIVGGPGAVKTTVTDNSFLWNFDIVDGTAAAVPTDNTDLFLQVSASPLISTLSTSDQKILDILEGLSNSPNLLVQEILASLNGAGTAQEVNKILDAAKPTVNGSDFTSSQTVSKTTEEFTGQRIADLRSSKNETGMSAGNMGQGVGAWGQVFGQHANQGDRENVGGYTANTWGGALGLDTKNISDKTILGLAFSYGKTTANSNNVNSTDTGVNNYQATLYGGYDLDKDTHLDGMASYTWGSVDETRHNVIGVAGLDSHGSYNTRQISAQAEASRDYGFKGIVLTPNVLAHWVNFNPDSYTETGAGVANLHVNGKTLNIFELGTGLRAGWSFKEADGSVIMPQLRFGYRYALVDDNVEDTAAFTGGGGAFTVNGATPARSSVDLGASLKFLTINNWELIASYDFDWMSDYTSSSGFLRATYKF